MASKGATWSTLGNPDLEQTQNIEQQSELTNKTFYKL